MDVAVAVEGVNRVRAVVFRIGQRLEALVAPEEKLEVTLIGLNYLVHRDLAAAAVLLPVQDVVTAATAMQDGVFNHHRAGIVVFVVADEVTVVFHIKVVI